MSNDTNEEIEAVQDSQERQGSLGEQDDSRGEQARSEQNLEQAATEAEAEPPATEGEAGENLWQRGGGTGRLVRTGANPRATLGRAAGQDTAPNTTEPGDQVTQDNQAGQEPVTLQQFEGMRQQLQQLTALIMASPGQAPRPTADFFGSVAAAPPARNQPRVGEFGGGFGTPEMILGTPTPDAPPTGVQNNNLETGAVTVTAANRVMPAGRVTPVENQPQRRVVYGGTTNQGTPAEGLGCIKMGNDTPHGPGDGNPAGGAGIGRDDSGHGPGYTYKPRAPPILKMGELRKNRTLAVTQAQAVSRYAYNVGKTASAAMIFVDSCDAALQAAIEQVMLSRGSQGQGGREGLGCWAVQNFTLQDVTSWALIATGDDPGIDSFVGLFTATQGDRSVEEWTTYLSLTNRLLQLTSEPGKVGDWLTDAQLAAKLVWCSKHRHEANLLWTTFENRNGQAPNFYEARNILIKLESRTPKARPGGSGGSNRRGPRPVYAAIAGSTQGNQGSRSGGNAGAGRGNYQMNPGELAKERSNFRANLTPQDKEAARQGACPYHLRKDVRKLGLCYKCFETYGPNGCERCNRPRPRSGN